MGLFNTLLSSSPCETICPHREYTYTGPAALADIVSRGSKKFAMNRVPIALAAILLLLMAVLSGGAARRESITIDEVAHIGAGVSYLQKLDMRMNGEHPPLAKVLAALPLVARGVHADYSDVSWSFSGHGFASILGEWPWGHAIALRWNNPYATVWWARVPMLFLTLLLGVVVYRCAAELGGPWAGLLCLVAYVTTPAFLVFGPLVVTDVAVTLFSLLTLWSFASLWRAPSRRTLVPFGLFLGAAFLSKFSSGLLLFCFLAFRLSLRWWPLPGMPKENAELRFWRRLRGRYMWKGIFLAAVAVYAVYFLLSWHQPSDALDFLGHGTAALILRRLLMPPWLYLRGLFFFASASSRGTFILGHSYAHGVWFYFPIIFVLKSTLAFLLMLALAIPISLVAKSKIKTASVIPPGMEFYWRAVWIFLLVFVAGCMLSRLTISIRHFSVPIVLLILLLAPIPRALNLLAESGWSAARLGLGAYVLLAIFSLLAVIGAYPYYFPFMNSLSFGRPAYALIDDSNLDWNQALPEVNRFVQQHALSRVLLDEYGFSDPTVYVPQAQFWNCQEASPVDAGQWAIVSASLIEDGHNCVWLLHFPHEAIAAGSMYAFQLPSVLPPVGDPSGPPPASAYHNFGGMVFPGISDSRLMFLNCERDPNQLQLTMQRMIEQYQAAVQKKRGNGSPK
jgi:4-amino-4-deoxy-L-arabinose transferase-like glycosyltransferase